MEERIRNFLATPLYGSAHLQVAEKEFFLDSTSGMPVIKLDDMIVWSGLGIDCEKLEGYISWIAGLPRHTIRRILGRSIIG